MATNKYTTLNIFGDGDQLSHYKTINIMMNDNNDVLNIDQIYDMYYITFQFKRIETKI